MDDVAGTTVRLPKSGLKLWQRMVCSIADRIETGNLTVRFGDGYSHSAHGATQGPDAVVHIRNIRPLIRLLTSGDLGFARSHIDGDWDSPDLGALLALAMANEPVLSRVMAPSGLWGKLAFFRHRLRGNTKRGSRRNIAFHYDLGNDFYRLWLDRTMTYSSAWFKKPDMTLAQAQEAKYRRIIGDLSIGPDDHVLEIGCGWGGFAEFAIATTGCRVTGLTLSKEQAAFARQRLEEAGLAEKADIRIQDYRECTGVFDKVVSIEMFEAVGEENWHTYFRTLRQRLKPGGKAMVQTITIHEDRFENYRSNADFIQTYIFPGGMLPSRRAFAAQASAAGLTVEDGFAFGKDYARTLRIWDRDFVAHWNSIAALGFDDRFKRMWRYYLHYCATGFDIGSIDVMQFRLAAS